MISNSLKKIKKQTNMVSISQFTSDARSSRICLPCIFCSRSISAIYAITDQSEHEYCPPNGMKSSAYSLAHIQHTHTLAHSHARGDSDATHTHDTTKNKKWISAKNVRPNITPQLISTQKSARRAQATVSKFVFLVKTRTK